MPASRMEPTGRMTVSDFTRLRPFQKSDLAPLVNFWNNAFSDRHNFYPITVADFENRVLTCPAFDPAGLMLAWHQDPAGVEQLVGLVHAFRPAPAAGLYLRWERRHHLALLYVDPTFRRQGIGSRLLRAAENWLYYCPVQVGGPAQPCYGTVEGPRPPFFGSSQYMGLSVHDTLLIRFLAQRGYRVVEPGDVSMTLTLRPSPPPDLPDLAALGLQLHAISHQQPFQGHEPQGRAEYSLYGDNGGAPYFGYVAVTAAGLLQAHISWYPLRQPGRAAIAGFWVAPALRGRGIGRYLLDRTLYDLARGVPVGVGYEPVPFDPVPFDPVPFDTVEVQTHLVKHAQAAAFYERRGFVTDTAWVNLSKECAVRGVKPVGLSAY